MSSQTTLDYLSDLDELDRLTYILDHFDSILNGEFIEFLKGQLEFAKKEQDGAGYFIKVFESEDIQVLNIMQKEMKQQADKAINVWNSVITVSSGLLDIDRFDDLSRISTFQQKKVLFKSGDIDCVTCGLPAEVEEQCTKCN
ncbi:MAG: hypothetical protein GXO86_13170 [Chlorobi bacterium]|nr:hypothetical protein [Chlorobiota bacterium]